MVKETFLSEFDRRVFVRVIAILGAISIVPYWYDNLNFLVTYPYHEGFLVGVIGYPIPFNHSLFYTIFFSIVLLAFVELARLKSHAWILVQVFVISSFIFLLLLQLIDIINSKNTFLSWKFFGLESLLIFMILFLNNNSVVSIFQLPKSNIRLTLIISGVFLVGGISAINFLIMDSIYY